jgi:phage-related protein
VKVTIQDQTRAVQAIMEQYQGGVNSRVKLMVVSGAVVSALTSEPELVENFIVNSAQTTDYVVTWDLGVRNPVNMSFPRRKQDVDQCSFRYKSPECGYVGGISSCDLTRAGPNGCNVHGMNFGGFPGVRVR